MKKQQKLIKKFLIKEFNEKEGINLFSLEAKTLDSLILNTKNKTKNQMKTLSKVILPRIALYKILSDSLLNKDEAYNYMKKYMFDYVAKSKHKQMVKMEKVPFFYNLYSSIFLKIMKKTDLQESKTNKDKSSYDVTITKCLWHSACIENNVKELCKLFCDVDDITYGNLKKIGFSRTKTLGYDGDCCDFHFFKK